MRSKWFTPYEILVQATSRAGELIALAGPRNPYPGKLGVIEEGAYAELLLVDGNPLENIELVGHPETSFVLIMKDGTIYKNTVEVRKSFKTHERCSVPGLISWDGIGLLICDQFNG